MMVTDFHTSENITRDIMLIWKYGSMMMTVVGVGKLKQKNMCCLNATDMEKSEEDGDG